MSALKKSLGLVALVFYGVGVIIGAGIYSVIGAAAGAAGSALWLAFLLAAITAGLTGLSYAELSAIMPRAGAEYVYLRRAFPRIRVAGFSVGLILSLANAATAATVAIAFGGYVGYLVDVPVTLSAAALLIVCTGLNIMGIQQTTWVAMVCTAIEVLGLILIIGAGWTTESLGAALTEAPGAGVMTGAAIIFFVYTGFEGLANLAEEARTPGRDMPRAIFISLGITTLLYILVALSVVAIMPPAELAESASPLSHAAQRISPRLGDAMAWIALFSTVNTALITVVVASRLLFGIARQGDLPAILGRTLPRRKSPWVAALVVLATSGALLPLGAVEVVAQVSSFATLLAFLGVHAALIGMRITEPEIERPFRVPWTIRRVPVPPVLGILSAIGLMTSFAGIVYAIALGMLALGVAVYWVEHQFGGGEPGERDEDLPDSLPAP